MRELFVYYRVATARAEVARVQVQRFQSALQTSHVGLQARLLRRPGEVDGVQTWMETYARPTHAGGVSQAVQDDIERTAAALALPIDGPRHCEVFEPL
jgi:hypothetical protein